MLHVVEAAEAAGCTIIRNRKRCNKCNKFWFRWSWF
jgi:hypothetical protein